MKTNKEKLAWLAGIIDGEGTISSYWEKPKKYNPKSRYFGVYIAVSNTDERITKKCLEIAHLGHINHYHFNNNKWKDWSCWKVKGENACKIAEKILPYLVSKRKQAKVILQWRKLKKFVGYHKKGSIAIPPSEIKKKNKIYNQLRMLNKRGKS